MNNVIYFKAGCKYPAFICKNYLTQELLIIDNEHREMR